MWKRSVSYWASSILCLGFLLSGCAGDDELTYHPAESPLTIQPRFQTQYDLAPTVSADASVLAWVRIGSNGIDDPNTCRVLRLRRASGVTDTLIALRYPIEALDISPDGKNLVGIIPIGADSALLALWRDGRVEPPRVFPLSYLSPRTPRWDGEASVIFGATGPEGGGVYRWDLPTDRITPVSVRFTDPLEEWSGRSPGIDRSGGLVCMERKADRFTFQAMVRPLDGGDELIYAAAGGSPHFWQLLPDEQDGLLYLDPRANLWAVRLATGDAYPILAGVYDYDVSPDGRWIFARASIPYSGLALILRDLRDLR